MRSAKQVGHLNGSEAGSCHHLQRVAPMCNRAATLNSLALTLFVGRLVEDVASDASRIVYLLCRERRCIQWLSARQTVQRE